MGRQKRPLPLGRFCLRYSSNYDKTKLYPIEVVRKGDKLVYVYDFRLDRIFNISVSDVIERHGEVAECRKYKSELQALDGYSLYLYKPLRGFQVNLQEMKKRDVSLLMEQIQVTDRDMLEAFVDDHLFDIEFVNEEQCEIPNSWESID